MCTLRLTFMKVTVWPKEDYGKFHEEDAYIVLNSHRIHEKTRVCICIAMYVPSIFHLIANHSMQSLTHEIHFWIGKLSTPDKYGTAAYRTVDLYRHVSQSQHYHILNDVMSTILATLLWV